MPAKKYGTQPTHQRYQDHHDGRGNHAGEEMADPRPINAERDGGELGIKARLKGAVDTGSEPDTMRCRASRGLRQRTCLERVSIYQQSCLKRCRPSKEGAPLFALKKYGTQPTHPWYQDHNDERGYPSGEEWPITRQRHAVCNE